MAAVTQDPEKTLLWEKQNRTRAAIAAIIGAAGLLVYYIAFERLRGDYPTISGLDSLERVGEGRVADLPSLRIEEFQYLQDHQVTILAIGIGAFIGFCGMAWAAGFLSVATRARAPEFRRFLIYLPIIGGVSLAIGSLVYRTSIVVLTNDFMDGPRTVAEATQLQTGTQQFAQILSGLGGVVLAIGLIFVSLNAMRVGLLTKLFGYIGIVAGAMLVIFPLPVVQVFWLAGVGVMLLGKFPGGDPPAWRTGKAEPWPGAVATAQARAERGGRTPATQPAAPEASSKTPTAGRSKRKKRH
ncbi:hypothetical protein OJ997_01320 [Solirubrobacter phytolaccae]|uniref:DUF4386 family protein n=1 Tax=Solirubrobacter phytolaccae TaxID=1404360 RepID=A0A9X3NA49_9ACTN|nr:hypothetical protein [Solirubrobacter phytolaccae]MDA0178917.1 hypothetical protein [Solirubrobacter phytolaccae]